MGRTKTDGTRQKIIAGLMCYKTLQEVADFADVSVRTVYNYLHGDADCADQWREQQRIVILETESAIREAQEQAVNAIQEVMQDKTQNPMARLKAAEMLLNRADTALNKVRTVERACINEAVDCLPGHAIFLE